VFVAFAVLTPLIGQIYRTHVRLQQLRRIEKKRGTRLITLIHRQESISLLGIPLSRYIDIDDSEAVLRAIRLTNPDIPIDLVIHTPGGLVLAAEQIAKALIRHRGKVTVFVPHYAMSGGTLIALAADEIVMDSNAVLGPVDPQVGGLPAVSILTVLERKPPAEIDDQTFILADVSQKALRQIENTVVEILVGNNMPSEKATEIARVLTSGRWTHDYPIDVAEAKALGLPVRDDLPDYVHQLMELFPQQPQRRPSVEYVPIPYVPEPMRAPRRER
jgi:ClpP class serine protease